MLIIPYRRKLYNMRNRFRCVKMMDMVKLNERTGSIETFCNLVEFRRMKANHS